MNAEKAAGGFDFLSCEPLVVYVYERRLPRTRTVDYNRSKCEMDFREEVYICCGWYT